MNLPPIVSQEEWQAALDAVHAKEKEHTRARDVLAADRRRLPRVRVEKDYVFDGPNGKAKLLDLFEARTQLIVYHFMFGPNQEVGCDGCSMFTDQVGHLAHMHARDLSFALVSRAPIEKIEAYRERMGWTIPWYSWFGGDFGVDFGTSPETPRVGEYQDGESFGLSVFIREGTTSFAPTSPRRGAPRRSAACGPSSTSHLSAARRSGRTHRRATRRRSRTSGGAATTSTRTTSGQRAAGRACPAAVKGRVSAARPRPARGGRGRPACRLPCRSR